MTDTRAFERAVEAGAEATRWLRDEALDPVEIARDILTAALPHLQGAEWQPISTAPKDGTIILLFVPDDDDGDVVWPAHWTLPVTTRSKGGWKHCSFGRWVAEDSDQRWQSLPTGPLIADDRTK